MWECVWVFNGGERFSGFYGFYGSWYAEYGDDCDGSASGWSASVWIYGASVWIYGASVWIYGASVSSAFVWIYGASGWSASGLTCVAWNGQSTWPCSSPTFYATSRLACEASW